MDQNDRLITVAFEYEVLKSDNILFNAIAKVFFFWNLSII